MTTLPLLATLLAATPAPADRLPVAAVVEKMQKNYDQVRDFRASFAQKNVNPTFKWTKVSTGTVAFKKPGLMRWDYEKPEPQMFLTTGQVLWFYKPEDKQAFKQDLRSSQLPEALAFLRGKGKLADEFDISESADQSYGAPGAYRLSLKPKHPQGTYKSIVFVVDAKTFFVTDTVLINAQGDVNQFTFTDLKVNTKIPDATFRWTPPADVRVVDVAKLTQK